MYKIKECAFLGKNHTVYKSGLFHNLDVLPEGAEIESEGFLTETGEYVTRHEATEDLHVNHEVQSEELDLNKAQPAPGFPNLGIENRRETQILDPKQVKTHDQLMRHAITRQGREVLTTKPPAGGKVVGRTSAAGSPVHTSFASSKSPSPVATQQHEDLHMMFNRVYRKFGKGSAIKLASNLYHAIPSKHRNALREYVSSIYKDKKPSASKWHEEHLAHLVTYLNSFPARKSFHQKQGTWDLNTNSLTEAGKQFNVTMKQAHRHLQDAAKKADKQWVSRFLIKSEYDLIIQKSEFKPSEADIELALDILHALNDEMLEFKAAKYMSEGYAPSQDEIEQALKEHEGDYEMAALIAYHVEPTYENLQSLKKLVYILRNQEDMSKSDMDVAMIPRRVKPFNNDAVHTANIVRQAFEMNDVYPLILKGKHSKGVALIKDHQNGELWLLKPGS